MREKIEKSTLWSAKHNAYLTYIKEGVQLPDGAVEVRGNRGARYYYFPERKYVKPVKTEKKDRPAFEEGIHIYPIPEQNGRYYIKRTGIGSRGVGALEDSVRAVNFITAWKSRETIDWDRMETNNVEFPTPDNPKRLHVHQYATEPHPISLKHPRVEARQTHKDEVIEFEKLYKRMPDDSWLDRYHIKVKQVTVPKFDIPALAYSCPGCQPLLAFEYGGHHVVYNSVNHKLDKFPTASKALDFVRRAVEKGKMITRINKMIVKSEDFVTDESVYSSYRSGEDEVVLSGGGEQYKVHVNGVSVLDTDDIRVGVNKYYSEIAKVLRSQTNDKDMALELLGEHVVQSNRHIREMMRNMSNHDKEDKGCYPDDVIEWLKDWDFSKISLDCFEKGFMMPPIVMTAGVPLTDEMGHARDGIDMKPSRGDLKPEDYKKNDKKGRKEQEPIEQGGYPYLVNNKP